MADAAQRPQLERGGLPALGGLLRAAACRRVLVVCGPSGRFLARLERELDGLEHRAFTEARRHVPEEVVRRGVEALAELSADCVVSLGGGSATGLAKALRLERTFHFVAVPTTYAGSELTDLFGITRQGGKRTGRDPRVVPDSVVYDLELLAQLPAVTSVQSAMNALAHPLSALSTGKLDGAAATQALDAAALLLEALAGLSREPVGDAARRAAVEGTIRAGRVLRASPLGEHHELAHVLGGRFDLDHAALHAVLLPWSVIALGERSPGTLAAIEERTGGSRLAERLLGYARDVGAPTTLAALGLERGRLDSLLRERPGLPRGLLERAFAGT